VIKGELHTAIFALAYIEQLFYGLNMRSAHGDLTSVAAIRNAAMRLFAEQGVAAVTVREIAAACGVSAPLVIHHYKSKDRLKEAVDEHVLAFVEQMFALLGGVDIADVDPAAMTSPFAELLEREPDVLGYLRRLLVDGGPPAEALFRRLYEVTQAALPAMEAAGVLRVGPDPDAQAAFLLVNDLGAVILRDQIRSVLGVDPLAGPGIVRWSQTVFDVYGGPALREKGRRDRGRKVRR
jgi:AcrR family transcriptional regulator